MFDTNPLILKLKRSGVLIEEDFRRLADLCRNSRTVSANSVLLNQGQKPSGLHLVLEGFVYRYKLLEGGERQIIGLLLPGDLCDLQAEILRSADHFIATLTDCAIVELSQAIVDDLTLAPSRIARALWWSTLVDESILREWLANMGQRPADKWLAHFFCELLLRLQVVGRAESNSCEVPFTQEKLADILGISSVHVNRVLKDLRERNLLHLKSRQVSVPDVEKLHAFSGFDPDYLHLAEL